MRSSFSDISYPIDDFEWLLGFHKNIVLKPFFLWFLFSFHVLKSRKMGTLIRQHDCLGYNLLVSALLGSSKHRLVHVLYNLQLYVSSVSIVFEYTYHVLHYLFKCSP